MAQRSAFQQLADLVGDLFDFVVAVLENAPARAAVIRDLGGDPSKMAALDVKQLPPTNLAAIKAYRESVSPGIEADAKLVRDIAVVLDAIIGNIEVWKEAFDTGDDSDAALRIVDELGSSLVELLCTAWVRHRWPRIYLAAEAFAGLVDLSSTYAEGDYEWERALRGLGFLFEFLFQPGKTLRSAGAQALNQAGLDAEVRLIGGLVGFFDVKDADDYKGFGLLHDIYAGWDHPSFDIDSLEEPKISDLALRSMVSFSLGKKPPEDVPDLSTVEQLLVSLMWVPNDDGDPGFLVALGGNLEIDERLNDRWHLAGRLRGDAGIAAILGGGMTNVDPGFTEIVQKVTLASKPDDDTGISFRLMSPDRSRLDIGQFSLDFELSAAGVTLTTSLTNAVFVIDGKDLPGFVKRLWPKDPVRLPFNVTFGYGSERGLILEGAILPSPGTAGPGVRNSPLGGNRNMDAPVINATLPLGKRLGPVTVHEIALMLMKGTPEDPEADNAWSAAADLSFSAQLGPAYFRLDQVGLATVLDFGKPRADSNLEFVDAHFGIKPPLGIAVNVDNDAVSGGGMIFHDLATGTYSGALALRLKDRFTLKAIGLVASKRPDGSEGSSFIVIATIEGKLLQIGPFTLMGLGLLIASDRTFDEEAMRAALPTGQLKTVLFPPDPVHNTTAIQRSLDTFFPARDGSFLFGLLVAMAFGSDRLIRLDLALVFQGGGSVSNRLIVLGRVSSLLPDEAAPLVRLNLDAVGIFDPSAGVAALDAVLVDSKLVGKFALTGSAAFRRTPGSGGFALSVGGFHPAFRPPDGFPALKRITLALTAGDNPKLICESYLAITSNTIQIGASASLYASACGFSVEGNVGFDALIEPLRFHYLAEFRASVQLKRGSRNLFKVSVSGALEGSIPLRVRGRASFEICWCDFSVGFDKTLVGGSSDRQLPAVDVLEAVRRQLGEPAHWVSELPRDALRMVTVRAEDQAPGRILVHPMGRLTVKQGTVPLNLTRDIDRVGAAAPSGDRRFAITRVTIGDNEQVVTPVRDLFAPAQFFDLTDDEKLAAPSFEEMDAGLAFGDVEYSFANGRRENSKFEYTEILVDENGTPHRQEKREADGVWVIKMLSFGAAALAPTRRGPAERFAAVVRDDVPQLRPRGWAVAEPGSAGTTSGATTWAEAKAVADRSPGRRVLVPVTEIGA
jgi:hypothetical protein